MTRSDCRECQGTHLRRLGQVLDAHGSGNVVVQACNRVSDPRGTAVRRGELADLAGVIAGEQPVRDLLQLNNLRGADGTALAPPRWLPD